MSDAVSAVLALPLIQPAQAQKHVTHNEALRRLDLLVQLAVADRDRTLPPADPAPGDRHIVPAGATGAWAGRAGDIALWDDGGWQFATPLPGWRAHVLAEGRTAVFDGSLWTTPDALPQTFPRLGVGATADAVNRLAVAAPASLFTHAGADHRLAVNKAAPGDTASLLFQTGFSARAEIGTAGSDDLALKVSPDGAAFHTALSAEAATGRVRLPAGLRLPDGTAALPALAFADDPDTGLHRPAADTVGIATNGAERLRVTAAGALLLGGPDIIVGVSFADPAAPAGGSLVCHRGNVLGTVSHSGASVTGALGERGTNANGAFERRFTGWATALRTDLSVTNCNTAYGALFRSGDITWTFPAAFGSGLTPVVAANAAHPDVIGARITAISNTAVTFQLVSAAAITGAITVHASARGRWSTLA